MNLTCFKKDIIVEISNNNEEQKDSVEDEQRMLKRIEFLVRSAEQLKKNVVSAEIVLAANGNYRVLMNGNVHPLWCGFSSKKLARYALEFCFS